MTPMLPPRRLGLLAAALLSACAAAGVPGPESGRRAPRRAAPPPEATGVFGPYLAGRFALGATDSAVAADNLLAALRADPDQPELVQRAFLAATLDGRADAPRLARRLPDNPVAAMLLAGADAQAGRWDRAEARLRAMPRGGPTQILQPVLLAWAQQGRGQPDAALATLRPLVENGRLRGLYAFHAALVADLAGRGREAERLARLALSESGEPTLRLIQVTAGILARGGDPAGAARLLEGIGRGHDDLALALGERQRRAVLADRPVGSAVEGMAEAHLALAAALRGQGAPDLALLLNRLALRLRPSFAPALLINADVLADQGRPEAALAALEQVPAEDGLAPVAALRRAGLLDRLDRTDDALAELARLGAARADAVQPRAQAGDILRRRDRFAEAATAYDAALALVPEPAARDWPLFYARGIARDRAGDWTGAEADFRRALTLSPEQAYVLNYLGYGWVEQGRNLGEARGMLERAVALQPQDGNIADSLGWALLRLGDLPGGVRWLEKAVELEPRNSVINDHLGDAYWVSGREREARFQWRRALALDPEPAEGPKIETKLRDGLGAGPFADKPR